MNLISSPKEKTATITYQGNAGAYTLLYFKVILFTIISFGLYYPWAKVAILKYHYKASSFGDSNFTFHGTGKEVFRGFLKIYFPTLLLYAFLIYAARNENSWELSLALALLYTFFIFIMPFAIHGAVRYRSSRSSWKGIRLAYLGNRTEFFWIYLRGLIFTIFTLGIYGAWFQISLRKYVISHLRLGNVSFNFKGEGKTLFWLNFKFFLFFYPTLGIYTFWYVKNLWNYYASNTEVILNEEKQKFSFTAQTGDIFELLLVNSLLLICTLGLAFPWVVIRTNTFIFKFLALENFDSKKIQKASYDNYDDASGEAALDMLDFDLI